MDFATNSIRIEQVTPEKAAEYLRYNYPHQRPRRAHHVSFLANEMRCGRFMSTAEIHLMFRNGEPVLVNGQHTCAAIVEYGKPVAITVRKTIVSDVGQIALTYAFGHDTGLGRTFNDAVGAYNLPEVTSLARQQVEALATAIRHIRGNFARDRLTGGVGKSKPTTKTSPADIVENIYEWAPDAKLVFTTMSNYDANIYRLIRKRGALAVALVTMRFQTEKSIEFWRGVAMPDGLAWADPRNTARRKLEESIGKAGVKGVTPERLSRQLARCWNAYYKGESLQMAKVSDDVAPIVILGTPFNGKQPRDYLPFKFASGTTKQIEAAA